MLNNWLNRITKQLILNTSPADMGVSEPVSNAEWIYDPDLLAVEGWPSHYWIITGDDVTLMDAAARATVDAVMLEAARDEIAAQLDSAEDIVRAFMLLVLDEFNAHALKTNSILDAIDTATTLAQVKSLIAAIPDYPQRTVQQIRDAIRDKLGS